MTYRGIKLLFLLLLILLAIAEVAYLTRDPNLQAYIFSERYFDAYHAAAQLGRLDLVSALLGIMGILWAIFSILGFGYVRLKAEQESKEAVKEYLEKHLPGLVEEHMQIHGRSYVEGIESLADVRKEIAEAMADKIAQAVFNHGNGQENGGGK